MPRKPTSMLANTHPELIEQLVDKSIANTLSTSTHKAVEWRCSRNHTWSASVASRTSMNSGCPYCSNRKLLPGFNDLATTHPGIAAELVDPSLATTITAGSNRKLEWKCPKGHIYTASPAKRTRKDGTSTKCPYCSNKKVLVGYNDMATTRPDLAAKCANEDDATHLTASSNKRITWRCPDCDTVFEAKVSSMATGHAACPNCAQKKAHPGKNDLATTHPHLASQLENADPTHILAGSSLLLEWRCPDCGNLFKTSPIYRTTRSESCPYCSGRKIITGVNDLATTHPDIAAELVDQSLAASLTANSHAYVEWECLEGHKWYAHVYNRTKPNGTGCPHCNGNLSSKGQDELANLVQKLLPNDKILVSDQTILPGHYELDIVAPSKHIAIEFNGTIWHSELYSNDPMRHKKKHDMATQAGYHLIHIWQDDWELRHDAIVRMIAAKLHADVPDGLLDTPDPLVNDRTMARKLTPQIIDAHTAANFLEANHIQGRSGASFHFGLHDAAGNLRALLSVRSPKQNARMNRDNGEYDIQRYATRGHVAGGFSKLVAYAESFLESNGTPVKRWISFSANDISDGSMYQTCGFHIDSEMPPDYRYVGSFTNRTRRPKEAFQKRRFKDDSNLFYDPTMTEHELALANKLYRCYDSGKKRWVKDVN